MNEAELSPWLNGQPPCPGVWQVLTKERIDPGYSYWDGRVWGSTSSTVAGAVADGHHRTCCTVLFYRGLAKDPNPNWRKPLRQFIANAARAPVVEEPTDRRFDTHEYAQKQLAEITRQMRNVIYSYSVRFDRGSVPNKYDVEMLKKLSAEYDDMKLLVDTLPQDITDTQRLEFFTEPSKIMHLLEPTYVTDNMWMFIRDNDSYTGPTMRGVIDQAIKAKDK